MTLELKKHTLMMTRVVAHNYVDQRSWKTGILERYLPGDSMATTAVSTAATRRAAPGASGLAAVLQGPVQCSRSTWGRMRCSQSHVRGGTCLDRTCWERVSRLLNGVSRRNSPIGQLQPALPEARRLHGRRARRKLSVLLSQFTYSQLAPRPPGLYAPRLRYGCCYSQLARGSARARHARLGCTARLLWWVEAPKKSTY